MNLFERFSMSILAYQKANQYQLFVELMESVPYTKSSAKSTEALLNFQRINGIKSIKKVAFTLSIIMPFAQNSIVFVALFQF